MIAADTSALSSYFKGENDRAVELVHGALLGNNICLPPVVLTELLSDPKAQAEMEETVTGFPLLALLDGYWERAGRNRRLLLESDHDLRLPSGRCLFLHPHCNLIQQLCHYCSRPKHESFRLLSPLHCSSPPGHSFHHSYCLQNQQRRHHLLTPNCNNNRRL